MRALFVSCLVLLVVNSAQTQPAPGTIAGAVRDLSGKPIAGATVYAREAEPGRGPGVRRPRRITTVTDSKGKFVIRNVTPSSYEVYAYKESEGYADPFFSFFATYNRKAMRVVQVLAGRTTNAVLELGPRYATLKLVIMNEQGNPMGASLTFIRIDDPTHPYGRGSDVRGDTNILIPPVAFRFEITAAGYHVWQSHILKPRSGETVKLTVRLTKS